MVLTDKELNEYLISIGGLTNVFSGNEVTDSNFFEVSLGWNLLIKNLIQDLIILGWDKEVIQVKEKFGGLRFYINEGTSEIHQRIAKAEIESMKICEITGKLGKLRTDIGWYRTLCDEEYLKIKKQDETRY
jgi:hypothetical protein